MGNNNTQGNFRLRAGFRSQWQKKRSDEDEDATKPPARGKESD